MQLTRALVNHDRCIGPWRQRNVKRHGLGSSREHGTSGVMLSNCKPGAGSRAAAASRSRKVLILRHVERPQWVNYFVFRGAGKPRLETKILPI